MIAPGTHGLEREVLLPLGRVTLPGFLTVPADALGVIAFAHGGGSSRLSPRNRLVAALLMTAASRRFSSTS